MSKNVQETIVNVEKPDVAAAPVQTPDVNPYAHLMRNLSKEEIYALSKEDKKAYVRLNTPRWKEEALTEVTGVFKNLEHRGGTVVFNFSAYPGEDYKTWEFTDGGHYRIPRGVAIHLNDDCYYKEYQEVKGDFGQERVNTALHNGQLKAANMQMATKVYRYAFHSLEFSRDELSISRSTLAQAYVSP